MALPDLDNEGFLPPGIHAASLAEIRTRFGSGSAARERQGELLRQIVEAAGKYETIKRILVWGSFVTAKCEPNDLDYSCSLGWDTGLAQSGASIDDTCTPLMPGARTAST